MNISRKDVFGRESCTKQNYGGWAAAAELADPAALSGPALAAEGR